MAFVKGERIIEDEGLTVIAQRVVGRGSEMHDSMVSVVRKRGDANEAPTRGARHDRGFRNPSSQQT
jgi:hypothetical protein